MPAESTTKRRHAQRESSSAGSMPRSRRGSRRTHARRNRGPAAAAANRDALLAAARELFATHGLDVPLTTIAQHAGVSQGVLYRHFPSKIDLALAIFDENIAQIQAAIDATHAGDVRQYRAALAELITLTVHDIAFIEIAVRYPHDHRLDALRNRLVMMLNPLIDQAHDAGILDADKDVDALFFALRAAYGLVATQLSNETSAQDEVESLLAALGFQTD